MAVRRPTAGAATGAGDRRNPALRSRGKPPATAPYDPPAYAGGRAEATPTLRHSARLSALSDGGAGLCRTGGGGHRLLDNEISRRCRQRRAWQRAAGASGRAPALTPLPEGGATATTGPPLHGCPTAGRRRIGWSSA